MNKEASNDKKEKKARQAKEMEEAVACNDTTRMWEIMRLMGSTNRGPRRRKLDVPLTEFPDADEWLKHLQQEGKDGACKAKLIEITETSYKTPSIQIEKEKEDNDDEETEKFRNIFFSRRKFLKEFQEAKNGRGVPEGMARKETWQILMEGSSMMAEEITNLWHDIHKEKNCPGTFRQSEGCQIPKGNNRQRCKAVRVIN